MGFTQIWKLKEYLVPLHHKFHHSSAGETPWILIDWNNFHMNLAEMQGGHVSVVEKVVENFCVAIINSGYKVCVIKDGPHDGSRAVIKLDRMLQKIVETAKLDLRLSAELQNLDSKYLVPDLACNTVSQIFERHMGSPCTLEQSSDAEVKYVSHTANGEADPVIRKFARLKSAEGCPVYIFSADGCLLLGVPETVSLVPIKPLFLAMVEAVPAPVLHGDVYSVQAVCNAVNKAGNDVMQALRHPFVHIAPITPDKLTVIYAFLEGENSTKDYLFSPLFAYLDNFLLPYEHNSELVRTLRQTKGWWMGAKRRLILISLFVRAAFQSPSNEHTPEKMIDALYASASDPRNTRARIYNLQRMNPSSYGRVCTSLLEINRDDIVHELKERFRQVSDRAELINTCKVSWPRRTALEPLDGKSLVVDGCVGEVHESTYGILNGLISMREQVRVIRKQFQIWKESSEGGQMDDGYVLYGEGSKTDPVQGFNAWFSQFNCDPDSEYFPSSTETITRISTNACYDQVTADCPLGTDFRFDRSLLYSEVCRGAPPGNPSALPQRGKYLTGPTRNPRNESGYEWGLVFSKNDPIKSETHSEGSKSPLLNLHQRGSFFDEYHTRLHAEQSSRSKTEFLMSAMIGVHKPDDVDREALGAAMESVSRFLSSVECLDSSSTYGNSIVAVSFSLLLVAREFHVCRDWFTPYYLDKGEPLVLLMRDVVKSFLYSAMFAKIARQKQCPADGLFGGLSVKAIKDDICAFNKELIETLLEQPQEGSPEDGALPTGGARVASARIVEIVEKIADQWTDISEECESVTWLDMQGMWVVLSALVPFSESSMGKVDAFVGDKLGIDLTVDALNGVVADVVDKLISIA